MYPIHFPPHKKHQSVKCVIDSNYFSVVRTAYKICYTMRQDCMKNVILLLQKQSKEATLDKLPAGTDNA